MLPGNILSQLYAFLSAITLSGKKKMGGDSYSSASDTCSTSISIPKYSLSEPLLVFLAYTSTMLESNTPLCSFTPVQSFLYPIYGAQPIKDGGHWSQVFPPQAGRLLLTLLCHMTVIASPFRQLPDLCSLTQIYSYHNSCLNHIDFQQSTVHITPNKHIFLNWI